MTLDTHDPASALGGAMWVARLCHEGQLDRGGVSYFTHVVDVARVVQEIWQDDELTQIALLHDVVEDTATTLDNLRLRFSDRVVAGVDAMSRREGESNREYILRGCRNPDFVKVKRIDWLNNLDPDRLARLDPVEAKSLVSQMTRSQKILGDALIAMSLAEKGVHCVQEMA